MNHAIPTSWQDQPVTFLHRDRHLCMVAEDCTSARPQDVRLTFHGLPWLTPILGTGCLDLADRPRLDTSGFKVVVEDWIKDVTAAEVALPDEHQSGDSITRFAQKLIATRSGHQPVDGGDGTDISPTERAGALLAVTTLVNDLYHQARATEVDPVSRWWTQEAVTLNRGNAALRPLLEAAEQLTRRLADGNKKDPILADPAGEAVTEMLAHVAKSLHEDVLRLEDVWMLTEISWLALIEGSELYPGWSELLVRLVLRYATGGRPTGTRTSPGNLYKVVEIVEQLLADPTAKSWSLREGGTSTPRSEFFDATAALLDRQAQIFRLLKAPDAETEEDELEKLFVELEGDGDDVPSAADVERDRQARRQAVLANTRMVRRANGDPRPVQDNHGVPHPVAFVTSFDIELEMALWQAGTPFRVVLPVLVQAAMSRAASIVWLSTDVDPPSAGRPTLEELQAGTRTWQLVSDVIDANLGGDRPIVVHLSGTPLFALPDLRDDPDLAAAIETVAGRRPAQVDHALTVDDYTSLLQIESEWFQAGRRGGGVAKSGGNETRSKGPDLPDCLAIGNAEHDRVLLGLGVQLDDPAIRSRIFAHLSVATTKARMHQSDNPDEPMAAANPPRGIAVNQRVDPARAATLRWLGISVVDDVDIQELTPEIDHVVDHLDLVLDTVTHPRLLEWPPESLAWHRPDRDTCHAWRDR